MEVLNKTELQSINLDIFLLKKGAMIFRAVNHTLRQQLIKFIDKKGEITVTDIYVKFRLEQSVASQQLGILRQAGFVIARRDGKYIYYSVNPKKIEDVHNIAKKLIEK